LEDHKKTKSEKETSKKFGVSVKSPAHNSHNHGPNEPAKHGRLSLDKGPVEGPRSGKSLVKVQNFIRAQRHPKRRNHEAKLPSKKSSKKHPPKIVTLGSPHSHKQSRKTGQEYMSSGNRKGEKGGGEK